VTIILIMSRHTNNQMWRVHSVCVNSYLIYYCYINIIVSLVGVLQRRTFTQLFDRTQNAVAREFVGVRAEGRGCMCARESEPESERERDTTRSPLFVSRFVYTRCAQCTVRVPIVRVCTTNGRGLCTSVSSKS